MLGKTKEVDLASIEEIGATQHIIGKDIAKFHCMYWPRILLSLQGYDQPKLPASVIVHSHWLMNNQKMSKSIGNVVEPMSLLQKYSQDSLRLYFLAKGPLSKDASFRENKLLAMHNDFLIDQYANLLQRTLTAKKLVKQLEFPIKRPLDLGQQTAYYRCLADELDIDSIAAHIDTVHFDQLFSQVETLLKKANAWLSQSNFWEYGD